MGKPPPNYQIGQVRSAASRKESARRYEATIWKWIVTIGIMEQPRTLREYAAHLTGFDVPTARGGPWTPGLVQRVMKAHNATPKTLFEKVTRPSPFEEDDWPIEVYRAYRDTVESFDLPSERTGRWLPVVQHTPAVCDLVRHSKHGEGQVVKAATVGRYLCSFLGEAGSFDIECPAIELETFAYNRSREERIALSERAREWFFRQASKAGSG